jgi:hypothetical protein
MQIRLSLRTFLRVVFSFVSLVFFLSNNPVLAQTPNIASVQLRSLEVDFWPEYDRAEMLVIYRAELDPAISLPTDVTFRIPARAGAPHAVAAGQANDSLFTVPSTRQVDGEWAYISFNTAFPIVRLEYYDSTLNVDSSERIYEYEWGGDYAVEQLLLQVQQPCEASNMQISPSLGSGVLGTDGLVYFTGTFGPLSQGQAFDLTIQYQKTSDCLSISTLDIISELPENTTGQTNLQQILIWVLALTAVVVLAGGVFWYWQSGRQKPVSAAPRRGRRSARSTSIEPDKEQSSSGSGVYCHQCGKRAGSGDRFCRSCGTKLRL